MQVLHEGVAQLQDIIVPAAPTLGLGELLRVGLEHFAGIEVLGDLPKVLDAMLVAFAAGQVSIR